MTQDFDYTIVGGGTAGCVLANRLSAGGRRVLLIEAGRDTPPGAVPSDILDPYPLSYTNPAYNWQSAQPPQIGYALTAETSAARRLLLAKVMGGGSSIMGMIMLRGLPIDYDGWRDAGAVGWGWQDVLPFFRRLETDLDFHDALHGQRGPTRIRRHSAQSWPPLARAAAAYARANGLPTIEDMNGQFFDGYGRIPIAGSSDQRDSAATAYLTTDVRARPNLKILSDTEVSGLLFEGGCVRGVSLAHPHQGVSQFRAKEVILTLGAIATPLFLQRQGIGPARELQRANVAVRVDRLGVGANLQNHASVMLLAHLKRRGVQGRPQRNHNNTMFRYSSGVDPAAPSDMVLAFASRSVWHAIAARVAHFVPILMAPSARGHVRLADGDKGSPLVEYRLLDDPRDERRMIDGFRRAAALVSAPPIAALLGRPYVTSRAGRAQQFSERTPANIRATTLIAQMMDWVPGFGDWTIARTSDKEFSLTQLMGDPERLRAYIRSNIGPLGHNCGTCKMGAPDDPFSVVDTEGRVIGVPGLRVADASVMPSVPRGNTNLPTLMVAEKMSSAILAP